MTHNALALAAVFALVLVTALTLAYLLLLRLPLSRERGSRGRTSPERITEMMKIIFEIMNAYDTNRAEWVGRWGDDAGFDSWFSEQCGVGQASIPDGENWCPVCEEHMLTVEDNCIECGARTRPIGE